MIIVSAIYHGNQYSRILDFVKSPKITNSRKSKHARIYSIQAGLVSGINPLYTERSHNNLHSPCNCHRNFHLRVNENYPIVVHTVRDRSFKRHRGRFYCIIFVNSCCLDDLYYVSLAGRCLTLIRLS